MARIELAHWMGKNKPGDIIEVADDDVAPLMRDGRVARVVGDDDSRPAPESVPEPPEAPGEPLPNRRRLGKNGDQ